MSLVSFNHASQWGDVLKQAAHSRKGGPSKHQRHQFIADDASLITHSRSQHRNKLSVQEIVEISKGAIHDLIDSFLINPGNLQAKEIIEITADIVKYTKFLIDGRKAKRNQFKFKLLRGIAWIIAILTSFIGIGIFIGFKLNQMNKSFDQEIEGMRKEIEKTRVEAENRVNLNPIIENQINRIPDILKEVSEKVTDDDRLNLLQKRMVDDFPKDPNLVYVDQFRKDIERDIAFLRKDIFLNIDDQDAQPSYQLKSEERVEAGANALRSLFLKESDKRWEKALQLVVNQTTLNNLFDPPISLFNFDSTEINQVIWEENGQEWALKADFSGHKPPIKLEIMRNAEAEIERVNVEAEGSLDIVRYALSGKQKGSAQKGNAIVKPCAMKAKLNYSITLEHENRPVISSLQSFFQY